MKSKKELQVKFHAPLNTGDTENQTVGCRANNPDICKNCYSENVCAFTRTDGMCLSPSAAWKKQFKHLSEVQK